MPAADVIVSESRRGGGSAGGAQSGSTSYRTVAIHQPNYFPNLAFFHKLAHCDAFIILDDVQYRRRGFINRNRIKTPRGPQWLTVPVCVKGNYNARISEILTVPERGWITTHERTLQHNYCRARFYADVMERVVVPGFAVAKSGERRLCEINVQLILLICDYLRIAVAMRRSSEFGLASVRTERLLQLAQAVGGTRYLSGASGGRYMDRAVFERAEIQLSVSEFRAKEYPQLWGEFVPRLSVLDALFNCGPEARTLV